MLILRFATLADVPAIVRVAAAAFLHDDLQLIMFPAHLRAAQGYPPDRPDLDGRNAFRTALTRKRFAKVGCHTIVVEDDALAPEPGDWDGDAVAAAAADGIVDWTGRSDAATDKPKGRRIVGIAQWQAPTPTPTPEQAEAYRRLEAADKMPATVDMGVYAMLGELLKREMGRFLVGGGWMCFVLGVEPAHERRGVGKMLVGWGVGKAREEGKGCYLISSERGRRLYLSVGFEDLGMVEGLQVRQWNMLIKGEGEGKGDA